MPEPPGQAPSSRLPPLVLVVDDELDIGDMLRQILERKGYRVAVATSATAALASLSREDPPRLVLADLMMPGLSIAEFRERLLGDASFADVPVVVLSGDPNAAAKAQAMGANGQLMKPIELASLLAEVRRHCPLPDGT